MTDNQMVKVLRNAYKYYDEVIYENLDLNKRDIALSSFQAGADYALRNKYDELKEDAEKKNDKPNIVQFLKDNGVYERFFANLFNQNQREDLYKYFTNHFFRETSISDAFVWSRTEEGINFWAEISARWIKQF